MKKYLYIVRNPAKSSIMFFVTLILCVVINSTFEISNSMKWIESNIREKLGYTVTIKGRQNNDGLQINDVEEQIEFINEYARYLKVIKELENQNGCQYSNYSSVFQGAYYNAHKYWHLEYTIFKDIVKYEQYYDESSSYLFGVQAHNYFEKEIEFLTLNEGTSFSEEQLIDGKPVCIAYQNHAIFDGKDWRKVKIGDIITVKLKLKTIDSNDNDTIERSKKIDLTVIGTYGIKGDDAFPDDKYYVTRRLYVPNQLIENMNEEYIRLAQDADLYSNNFISENVEMWGWKYPTMFFPRFDLDNQEHLDEFVNRAEELLKENNLEDYQIVYSQSRYNKIAPSVDNMKKMAKIVQIAGSLLLMLILSFMISIFIKDRKKEIGIYMALGESKKRLMVRFISEIMVVSIFAILLSFPISNGISNRMIDSLKNTKTVISQKDENGLYDPTMEHTVSIKKVIENMDSSIEPIQIIMLIGIDVVVILISASGALMMVSKTNPKEVLLGDK